MSGLLARLGRLLSVNPEWTTSILPPNSFRIPSPGSLLDYTPPPRRPESNTTGYAYFKRDSRRNFGPEISVKPVKLLAASTNHQVSATEPPLPGKRYNYVKSSNQPPATGYFPIINCE